MKDHENLFLQPKAHFDLIAQSYANLAKFGKTWAIL